MRKKFLEVGKVINTHGIKGELKFQLWCDGVEFLQGIQVLYLDSKGEAPIELLSVRPQKSNALIRLAGIGTIEQAERLKNKILYINRDDARLSENSYFIQDIIGCKVFDIDNGFWYGTVKNVVNLGASDIYEVKLAGGGEAMIPVIPDIVKTVNIADGKIEIKKMKGLFEDED